ncbi:MAG: histidine utilization repressor [Desulfobacteraceae bacterium]|jgi:GntR family histidine utilization transcriptional repressor
MTEQNDVPLYQQVKDHILEGIRTGVLKPGMKIESEVDLVKKLNVSRMTVNRALRELTADGRLTRVQGSGTFIARIKPQSALLEIRSIADEIKERGGVYSCDVHLLQEEKARPSLALEMGLKPYASVFHSIIVHKDKGIPIQLGYRFVNPEIAPAYLKQDFTTVDVAVYLLSQASPTVVEHVVEAIIPEPWIRDLLLINASEPCLALYRKTWVGETVATISTFYSPGSRYTLGGRFSPPGQGGIGIT